MRRRSCSALLLLALVGCSTLTIPEERQLGAEFDHEARRQYRFINDPIVVGYVSKIGQDVVRVAGPQPFEYRFYVIDEPEINAFAGPGGSIYVQSGTILAARNVSELAGVIAHEVGHVERRHIAQNYNKQRAASIGQEALVVGAGIAGGSAAAAGANLLGGLGTTAVLNSFGREAEREADDFAIGVLPQAGYDPNGLPSFFETLQAKGGSNVPEFLSSHPATSERLAATRAAIAKETLPPDLRVDDDGRLEIIQQRIRLLTDGERPYRPGGSYAPGSR
jgi:predicted Zn-dependent protease